jgi:monovalent cation/hydrogen antiporter
MGSGIGAGRIRASLRRKRTVSDFENLLILLACVAVLSPVADRLKLAQPIVFVLGGLLLSLVPRFPAVPLDPEIIFFVCLPPLLYLQAFFTSWRDFKRNLRPISQLAVGLVLFTSAGVALLVNWLIPEVPLAAGFVLGAIVSPPDAVAVTAVAKNLRLPRRLVTVLEGESLVNDATGLVTLKFALAALASGSFSLGAAAGRFALVAVGGVLVGAVCGWLVGLLVRRLREDSLVILLSLLCPFASYLPAEHLGCSGVLAVVTTGLWLGWTIPEHLSFSTRLQGTATWRMVEYVLNGLIFLMIGLQLRFVLSELREDYSWSRLAMYALAACVAVIVLRPLWIFPVTYGQRWLIGCAVMGGCPGRRFPRGGARAAKKSRGRPAVPGQGSDRLSDLCGDPGDARSPRAELPVAGAAAGSSRRRS